MNEKQAQHKAAAAIRLMIKAAKDLLEVERQFSRQKAKPKNLVPYADDTSKSQEDEYGS